MSAPEAAKSHMIIVENGLATISYLSKKDEYRFSRKELLCIGAASAVGSCASRCAFYLG
jgi:hypothetical protein